MCIYFQYFCFLIFKVEKSQSLSPVRAQNETYVSPQNRHISEASPELKGQPVNGIAHLWTFERPPEDEIDIFAKFVATQIRVLSRNDQFSLKKRIQQLLLEYEPVENIIEPIKECANLDFRDEVNQAKECDMSSNQSLR